MAQLKLPHLSDSEQALLYQKLNQYNRGRASYKEAGAYLLVLPRESKPLYTLWIYAPLPSRQSIFYLCDLSADIHEALRMASTLCFYSTRCLFLMEYNAKRMQSKGEDLIPFGKYRGHFLHEILNIDPAYIGWIAYKFEPRIPKQARLALIARIYYTTYQDIQRRRMYQEPTGSFLGKEGDRLENLTLTVTAVRIEDNPYRTCVRNGTSFFYVRQQLRLKDGSGNCVALTVNARTASRHSCTLPATEHAFQVGETLKIASARVARTYMAGRTPYTRLHYVRLV